MVNNTLAQEKYRLNKAKFEDILSKVNKPARYLGCEINSTKKNINECSIKIALCFPDLYEIGMSYLGMRILYGILNSQSDIACERVFSPGKDLENILRCENISLFSLESKLPLKEFDILGFSLCYELNYTNVLNILDLAGIDLRQSQRKETFPLIIAGGNCCLNPEPLAEFFDLFFIGEAEEAILEIINIVKDYKTNNRANLVVSEFQSTFLKINPAKGGIIPTALLQRAGPDRLYYSDTTPPFCKKGGPKGDSAERSEAYLEKEDLLYKLSKVKGVYVPSLYNVEYEGSGSIKSISPYKEGLPEKISKRIIKDIDNSYYPSTWIIPYISIVHDHISLELMRGCPHRCFFCQGRAYFSPLRIRSLKKITDISQSLYKSTGYEEFSLLSLSTSDYPYIYELVELLMNKFNNYAVGVSLPSLQPKSIVGNLSELITKVRKTTFTFAPEAGTQRLRKTINKDFDMQALFDAVKSAKKLGYRQVKLYFMIGLPSETRQDLDGIVDLVSEIFRQTKLKITLSISNFIPKSHTAFERLGMEGIEELKQKQGYLRTNFNQKRIKAKVNFHDIYMGYIEAVFARGDRRLSECLYRAFKFGARFDSWSNEFDFALWKEALKSCPINPDFYARRRIKLGETLPWGHIDVGAV